MEIRTHGIPVMNRSDVEREVEGVFSDKCPGVVPTFDHDPNSTAHGWVVKIPTLNGELVGPIANLLSDVAFGVGKLSPDTPISVQTTDLAGHSSTTRVNHVIAK